MILNLKSFLINAYLSGDRSPYIFLGAPGIGKTAQTQEFAKEIANELLKTNTISSLDEFEIKIIPLSQIDKFEISGAPRIVEREPGKFILDYVPNGRLVPSQKRAIIILDEITTCYPDVQTAALSMINEKIIGNIKLPDDVMFVCLGNNKEDHADFRPLIAPFISRCTILKIEPEINNWLEFSISNSINKYIYNFIKETHSTNFLEPVPDRHTSFACPRTWTLLSERLNKNQSLFEDNNLTELGEQVILGTVGDKKGKLFIQYIKDIKKYPNITELLKNPSLLTKKNLFNINNVISLNYLLTEYSYDFKVKKQNMKKIEEIAKFLIASLKLINENKTNIDKSLIIALAIYWIKAAPNGGDENLEIISNKYIQELILDESIKSSLNIKN